MFLTSRALCFLAARSLRACVHACNEHPSHRRLEQRVSPYVCVFVQPRDHTANGSPNKDAMSKIHTHAGNIVDSMQVYLFAKLGGGCCNGSSGHVYFELDAEVKHCRQVLKLERIPPKARPPVVNSNSCGRCRVAVAVRMSWVD